MKNLTAGDLMIPLADYAVVSEDATIPDAIRALDEAQQKVRPGHQPHRAVLVVNAKGQIVGKVGHFAFLKGLEPNYQRMGDWEAIHRAGLSREFLSSLTSALDLWRETPEAICRRAKHTKVRDIMRPVALHVDESAPLTEVIHLLILNQTLSILVTKGQSVVGIVRLSDVFTHVFAYLKTECEKH